MKNILENEHSYAPMKHSWSKHLTDIKALIEIVHWRVFFSEKGRGWIKCDQDGFLHHYNIYVYAYKDSDLYSDIANDEIEIPFHCGETYRDVTENMVKVGCDFSHAWGELDSVGLFDGNPPHEVISNALEIEQFLTKVTV